MSLDRDEPLLKNPLSDDVFQASLDVAREAPWIKPRKKATLSLLEEASTQTGGVQLISRLLKRIHFSNSTDWMNSCSEVYSFIDHNLQLEPEDTFIVALNKSNASDSSEAFLWSLKPAFSESEKDWHTARFIKSLAYFLNEKIDECSNVVFVDEFSGTGGTVKKLMKWMHTNYPKIKSKNCYLALHAAMEIAPTKFDEFFQKIHITHLFQKGISDFEEDVALQLGIMENLERMLGVGRDGQAAPRFGYGMSEALYGSEAGNTPNNVFPIFWWVRGSTGKRLTLFRRLA